MQILERPRAALPGARIAIAAPAGPVDPDALARGEAWLRELGFEPVRRADLLERRGYLAGDDARRAAELMDWVRSDEVAAIVCARGGYGCHRIVSQLDADAFRRARKPLVGYSDVTTLHLWQARHAGLAGIHGAMLERPSLAPESRESLRAALLGESLPPLEGSPGAPGVADGPLVGGSLSVSVASLGTPWEIDTAGAILLIEDITEPPYRIDRMLQQLLHAGKLESAAGVGVGQLVECGGGHVPRPTAAEVVEEILSGLGVPVAIDLPFGHCDVNRAWPMGGRGRLDGDRGVVELLDSAVQKG